MDSEGKWVQDWISTLHGCHFCVQLFFSEVDLLKDICKKLSESKWLFHIITFIK